MWSYLSVSIHYEKKNSPIKIVLDASHLNSNTDHPSQSWLPEPLATQLANKKFNSAIHLMYAYAYATLDIETINITSFSSGDELLAFIERFYGLKGLPNIFTPQMSPLKDLIRLGYVLVCLDDILLMSNSKTPMMQLFKQLHEIASSENLKIPCENLLSCFSL